MTDWKEHPNLFADGGFKAKIFPENEIINIEGIDLGNQFFLDGGYTYSVDDCTLIARPISDMTDDEHDMWTRKRYSGSEGLFESPCSFNYLLSIGCLPKIWEYCFDDGTVIDATKLPEAV